MNDYNMVKSELDFLRAQIDAEIDGEKTFTCPICGGKAVWAKTFNGNHLSECSKCGFGLSNGGYTVETIVRNLHDFLEDFIL